MRWRASATLLLAFFASAWLGCAVITGKPMAPSLSPRDPALRDPDFAAVLQRFASRFVDPERIDPGPMLDGGLAALAASDERIEVRTWRRATALRFGESAVVVDRDPEDLTMLAARLDAAVGWLAGAVAESEHRALVAASLRGAVRAIDRWATVVAGESRQRLKDRMQGSLVGVGVKIGRRDGAIRVLEVYRGSGAHGAGVEMGDRIVAVDGEDLREAAVSELVSHLRGADGSTLRVAVERGDPAQTIELDITRRRFAVRTVSSRMPRPDFGHLTVHRIAKNTGPAAARMLTGLRGAPGLRGIVLDLRGNSGGSVLNAGQIADQFVTAGRLIDLRGRGGGPPPDLIHRVEATPQPADAGQPPLVILVDHKTASSAEFLTAALLHLDRALLVGEKTLGKTVVQKTYDLGQQRDLTLKVTVARSFAGGELIPEHGLVPDVLIATGEEDVSEPGCGLGAGSGPVAIRPVVAEGDGDPALDVALDLLDRFGSASRARMREAIQRDRCDAALAETG